jgi:hypothetical protein
LQYIRKPIVKGTMLDTTPIATEIARLLTVGATQRELIAVVANLVVEFPDMTSADLSVALQQATATAEQQAKRGMQAANTGARERSVRALRDSAGCALSGFVMRSAPSDGNMKFSMAARITLASCCRFTLAAARSQRRGCTRNAWKRLLEEAAKIRGRRPKKPSRG